MPAIADLAREVGALLVVDGVHLTPHAAVDVQALGADVYLCSPYKWLGPHLGVMVAEPLLLEGLHPDKLLPSSAVVPERFELGTLPYELLAGTTAAVDVLSDLLAQPSELPRRERVLASMAAVQAHEAALAARLREGLAALPGVRVVGSPERSTPTVLFTVAGHAPAEVATALAARGVNAPAGSFYALEASRALGLGDGDGVRAGIACYTTAEEVDRLLAGVGALLHAA